MLSEADIRRAIVFECLRQYQAQIDQIAPIQVGFAELIRRGQFERGLNDVYKLIAIIDKARESLVDVAATLDRDREEQKAS